MPSEYPSPWVTGRSLQQLFQGAIAQIMLCTSVSSAVQTDPRRWLTSEIPMKRVQRIVPGASIEQPRVQYVSAVAQQLAASVNDSPGAIAQELATSIAKVLASHPTGSIEVPFQPPLWPHIKIEATEAGWLFFSLSDRGLAAWLEAQYQACQDSILSPAEHHVSTQPSFQDFQNILIMGSESERSQWPNRACDVTDSSVPTPKKTVPDPWQDLIWQGQYAHARCCAVARLAIDQGLLSRSPAWLSGEMLRSHSTEELGLIASLIDVWDLKVWDQNFKNWADPNLHPKERKRLKQQLQTLSQQSLTLYTQSPLFGDWLRHQPEQVIVRLWLLQIARLGLKQLLENGLGFEAPEFL
ncbi:MAG: hypothetical protein WBA57_19505 [Elainellaceae cyanobacterium]